MLAEKSNFSIVRMVRLLAVSRSGYYAWIDRAPSPAAIRRVHIEQKVAYFHGDSDEVYGSPRILADLRADGEIISRKTVAATMRRLGLIGICPKKWKITTIIDHTNAYPVDAVKRQWDTGVLNQVWVGDITYLPYRVRPQSECTIRPGAVPGRAGRWVSRARCKALAYLEGKHTQSKSSKTSLLNEKTVHFWRLTNW